MIFLSLAQGSGIPPEGETFTEVRESSEFLYDPGGDCPELRLPGDETLVYRASIELTFVKCSVGTVTQTCKVVPYRSSVLLRDPSGPAEGQNTAVIRLRARGDYSLYSIDSTIETRILPQAWPRILHHVSDEGTEKRSREVMLGLRGDDPMSSYRKDTDKGAPKGTRIWKEPKLRSVPEGTLDLLTAVYHTRKLIRDGLASVSFPLLDKDCLWEMTLLRGERRTMETPAGSFHVVEVSLQPKPYPGESISAKKVQKFEGILGLNGAIHLWVEARTGIPVRIEGDLPVGPITLGIDVVLSDFAGTPARFRPLPEQERK